MMQLEMKPCTPLWEPDRWYIVLMEREGRLRYHVALYTANGGWVSACGTDLEHFGWRLLAISDELPLLSNSGSAE